jgi:hypothetical protein
MLRASERQPTSGLSVRTDSATSHGLLACPTISVSGADLGDHAGHSVSQDRGVVNDKDAHELLAFRSRCERYDLIVDDSQSLGEAYADVNQRNTDFLVRLSPEVLSVLVLPRTRAVAT